MSNPNISTIIDRMEDAIGVVTGSEHDTSKVAACVFQSGGKAKPSAAHNERPAVLRSHYEWKDRLGVSSQFVHAELAALSRFTGEWHGASICVTDPFCPNCAKNLAEAGVREIYIDHKGFQKDFAARNGGEFESMSMLIAAKAGMNVHVLNRKEKTLTPILEQATITRPSPSGIEFFDLKGSMSLEWALEMFRDRLGTNEAWAIAFVTERDGTGRGLLALEALPPGFTPDDFLHRKGAGTGKYRFPIDPVTRLMITARRMGFIIQENRVGCAQVPSSRALVNGLEFGLKSLILASKTPDHDLTGVNTLEELQKKLILQAGYL